MQTGEAWAVELYYEFLLSFFASPELQGRGIEERYCRRVGHDPAILLWYHGLEYFDTWRWVLLTGQGFAHHTAESLEASLNQWLVGAQVGQKAISRLTQIPKYSRKEGQGIVSSPRLLPILSLVILMLTSCTQPPEPCPSYTSVRLSEVDRIADDASLPFRFPLDQSSIDETPFFGWFGVFNWYGGRFPWSRPFRKYHAAEDYRRPAGTPIYAMADGQISFSGPMGGYGWLIIIDHPQANIYSLYGHLSPSRWRMESGTVARGQLIAYLGDSDENGGSSKSPLEPHLHFGIRSGQRADYPGRGEWRWQAGWIKPCPQDLGWLQPSQVIASQDIPAGGYPQPRLGFLDLWRVELLITGIYTMFGVGMLLVAIRKDRPLFLLFPGIVLIAAGIVFHNNGSVGTYALLAIGIVLEIIGGLLLIRRSRPKLLDQA